LRHESLLLDIIEGQVKGKTYKRKKEVVDVTHVGNDGYVALK